MRKTCVFCGGPSEGRSSIHRVGFGLGREVWLCDRDGALCLSRPSSGEVGDVEPTAEMKRTLYAAGSAIVDRVDLSLRSRDFPEEVRSDLCARVLGYLWQFVQSYASLPVPARGVYVTYARQDVAVSRLVLSQSLGKSPQLTRRGESFREESSYPLPDLTSDEKSSVVRALLQTEDVLCSSMEGLGQREAEALAEATDEFLGVFDLAGPVVCS